MLSIILSILVILALIGSIFAWFNTNQIIDELNLIKEHLGIEEEVKSESFLEKDVELRKDE